jgi:hypothetical protein
MSIGQQPSAPARIERPMHSAEDYRRLAAEARRERERATAGDVRNALLRLAEAYDNQANVMDGKRARPR